MLQFVVYSLWNLTRCQCKEGGHYVSTKKHLFNEVKSEFEIFTILFSFYFVVLAITKLYYLNIIRMYPLQTSLSKIIYNPLFIIALAMFPIAFKFYSKNRNEKLDKILISLLYAYGLGKFTAYTQYLNHIMTLQIIIRTVIPIIICCIIIYNYMAFFNTSNELRYTIGILLASLLIYLQEIDLYFYFLDINILAHTYSEYVLSFVFFSLNLIIIKIISSD